MLGAHNLAIHVPRIVVADGPRASLMTVDKKHGESTLGLLPSSVACMVDNVFWYPSEMQQK